MSDLNRALMAWMEAKVDSIQENTREAVIDLTKEGAEITEHHVRTRGISKPGRIDTGAMVDSVSWTVDKDTGTELETSFGFKDAPSWTVWNEYGTRAIPPMYALTDAADEIESKVRSVIGDAVKRS